MTAQELELPKGWAETKLIELCLKITDGTHFTPKYTNSGIPFISIKDIKNEKISFENCKFVSQETHDQLTKRCNPELNDLLITKSGTIGRMAIITTEQPFSLFVSVALIKPLENINRKYLLYVLQNFINHTSISQEIKGGVIKNFHLEDLREVKIPLPPLNEQKRIVSKIEELFSKIDSTKQSLEQTKLQLEQYRHSLLKSAFEGKLTEDWRLANQEQTGEIFFHKIQEKKDTSKTKNYETKIIFNKKFPKQWYETTIIDVSDVISGKTPKDLTKYEKTGIIPFFKVTNMNNPENLLYMSNSSWNLEYDELKEAKLHVVKSGTVIFPKRGGAIKTNKKRILNQDSCYDLNIMGISPILMPSKFIYYWLLRINLEQLSDGSNVPQINHKDIEPLQFHLPPLEEQEQIVSQIEQGFSLIENTQNIVNSTLQTLQTMKMSVLKQAFEGKLVPQDPNDEPAHVLLEKIKSTKEVQPAKKRRAKNVK